MSRQEQDFYSTPSWCAQAILPHLTPGPVFDPFAGTGVILKAVAGAPGWGLSFGGGGFEIDPDRARIAGVPCADAFKYKWHVGHSVITNPPYSIAQKAVAVALRKIPKSECAFLLRLGFLGSGRRAAFHAKHPADILILPHRPCFVVSIKCTSDLCKWRVVQDPFALRPKHCPKCGGHVRVTSSDSSEYGWFVYGPGRGGHHQVLNIEPYFSEYQKSLKEHHARLNQSPEPLHKPPVRGGSDSDRRNPELQPWKRRQVPVPSGA